MRSTSGSLVLALAAALLSLPARAEDTEAPKIFHVPVTAAERGAPIQITARVTDQSKCFPQVFYRWDGAAAFEKPVAMKKVRPAPAEDRYEVSISAKGALFEYYVEAFDELGNGPARAGSPEAPFKVRVGAPAPAQQEPAASLPAPAAPTLALPGEGGAGRRREPLTASTGASAGGRVWTWVAGGAGVGLLLGGALAGIAFHKADDAYNARLTDPTNNPATLRQQFDANQTLGTMSTVSMIGGAVLLAGGVALYFFEPLGPGGARASSEAKDEGLQFAASPTPGGAAALVAGRF